MKSRFIESFFSQLTQILENRSTDEIDKHLALEDCINRYKTVYYAIEHEGLQPDSVHIGEKINE